MPANIHRHRIDAADAAPARSIADGLETAMTAATPGLTRAPRLMVWPVGDDGVCGLLLEWSDEAQDHVALIPFRVACYRFGGPTLHHPQCPGDCRPGIADPRDPDARRAFAVYQSLLDSGLVAA